MTKGLLFSLCVKACSKPHGMLKTQKLDLLIEKFLDLLDRIRIFGNWESFTESYVNSIANFKPAEKFLNDPETFLESMMIVLRPYSREAKGTILIAYNYAFPVFLYLFDARQIAARYHIVLEPSTARYFMPEILVFKSLKLDIYVETPEIRDAEFLNRYLQNLKPVPVAANWWIDDRIFYQNDQIEKEFDLIMASSWLKAKRHFLLFRALRELKDQGVVLTSVLVGYPIDLTIDELKSQAIDYGIEDQITFFEWLTPLEVAELYRKSRLNLLLSKREGCNRSIIEGFYCNVPCLIRDGFNFGQKYDHINEKTGAYFNDSTLAQDIVLALDRADGYSPSEWVRDYHMDVSGALAELGAAIYGSKEIDMAKKTSSLHGMKYWDQQDKENFVNDYNYLLCSVRPVQNVA